MSDCHIVKRGTSAGTVCVYCHTDTGAPVLKIRDARVVGSKTETLHRECARDWFRRVTPV
jgi:hypothetical protein